MDFSFENIYQCIEDADNFLNINGIEKNSRLLYKLFIEEQLLNYKETGHYAEFELLLKKNRRRITVQILIPGAKLNTMHSPDSVITKSVLSKFKKTPEWEYHKGRNVITFSANVLAPDLSHLKYVLKYMTKKKSSFIWAVIFRFLNMALLIVEPILSAEIIVAYSDSQINKILMYATLILIQSVSCAVITYFASRMLRQTYGSMLNDMQTELAQTMLEIKTKHMDENGNGLFSQRLVNETKNVVDNIDGIIGASTDIFQLVGLLVSFAIISVPILFFEFALFVLYILIQYFNKKSLSKNDRHFRTLNEQELSLISEMAHASRDIKLSNSESVFMKKLSGIISNTISVETDVRLKSMGFILLRNQFLGITNFIFYVMLAVMMVSFGMAPATALVLFNYNGRIYGCSNCINSLVDSIYSVTLSSERIYQLMHSPDYETESFGDVHLDTVKGGIEFRDVHFSYSNGLDNTEVLRGINLKINAGESVAFVGKSGCGKTTILSLIARLYDPGKGDILLDGTKVSELDRESLRGNITMVSQSPYIFNMSIRDNFKIIKDDLTDEDIIEVCKTACIHDDIVKMPNGYDTLVGEGGIQLSGGQRQRIALARSLLNKHPIIMLDEATSALDNLTQKNIRLAIENLRGKSTIIMVAHRLSTVINCEKIFFISDGQVLASGTHEELLKNCPDYQQLYQDEVS